MESLEVTPSQEECSRADDSLPPEGKINEKEVFTSCNESITDVPQTPDLSNSSPVTSSHVQQMEDTCNAKPEECEIKCEEHSKANLLGGEPEDKAAEMKLSANVHNIADNECKQLSTDDDRPVSMETDEKECFTGNPCQTQDISQENNGHHLNEADEMNSADDVEEEKTNFAVEVVTKSRIHGQGSEQSSMKVTDTTGDLVDSNVPAPVQGDIPEEVNSLTDCQNVKDSENKQFSEVDDKLVSMATSENGLEIHQEKGSSLVEKNQDHDGFKESEVSTHEENKHAKVSDSTDGGDNTDTPTASMVAGDDEMAGRATSNEMLSSKRMAYRGEDEAYDSDSSVRSSSSVSSSSSIVISSDSDEEVQEAPRKQIVKSKKKGQNKDAFEVDMRTKGELLLDDLPPIEELKIDVDEKVSLIEVGRVHSILGPVVVVQANKLLPALDEETILFTDDRQPLGQVFETFGPVQAPLYIVRFNSADDISKRGVKLGDPILYAPDMLSYTRFVFLEQLKQLRGSDASWEHNNEPPSKYLDFSDDEEERKARRAARQGNWNEADDDNDDDAATGADTERKRRKRKQGSHKSETSGKGRAPPHQGGPRPGGPQPGGGAPRLPPGHSMQWPPPQPGPGPAWRPPPGGGPWLHGAGGPRSGGPWSGGHAPRARPPHPPRGPWGEGPPPPLQPWVHQPRPRPPHPPSMDMRFVQQQQQQTNDPGGDMWRPPAAGPPIPRWPGGRPHFRPPPPGVQFGGPPSFQQGPPQWDSYHGH